MRISSKGRYALAAITSMAMDYSEGECITVISISEKLGISKIYLEQVFSLLKRGGIVNSIKGSQGGYQLVNHPLKITLYDILAASESSLFEVTEETVSQKAPDIEAALRESVFGKLDEAVEKTLKSITLYDIAAEAEKHKVDDGFMYYI